MSSKGDASITYSKKEKPPTAGEAINQAGGFGLYQLAMAISMILGNNGPGLVVYGIAYFELEPTYICTYSSPPKPSDDDDSNSW